MTTVITKIIVMLTYFLLAFLTIRATSNFGNGWFGVFCSPSSYSENMCWGRGWVESGPCFFIKSTVMQII